MCALSVILDYGMTRIPRTDWTPEQWDFFKGVCQKAREFDEAAAQPDCPAPDKLAWYEEVEAQMRRGSPTTTKDG